MRIAFVAPSHPYRGGIAHFAARLAGEMSACDDILLINFTRLYPSLLFPGKTQFDTSQARIDYPSERIIDSLNPLTWRKAASRITAWNADAVVFHYWHPFFAPAYRVIAKAVKARRLMICHNVISHDGGAIQSNLAMLAFKCMDGLLVHARQEQVDLKRIFPNLPLQCAFHPIYDIFPDAELDQTFARRELGLASSDSVVLYFGLIRPYKGVDVLLEAAKSLQDVPNLKILVVGEVYGDRTYLERALAESPTGMVTLIDQYIPNEEVGKYFRAADIVALPYRSATQSGVIPTAYAHDRPVIATLVGGLPEAILEGESGYLVPPGDAKALANSIRGYFNELGKKNLQQGIAIMRARLGWNAYADILRGLVQLVSRDGH